MIRRCNSTASPASLPDDDDLLREILLRLPPQPSSLPRASAVCKRWQRIVTDHQFLRRFRAHHRKPPLLGVFEYHDYKIVFRSLMDSPDHIPPHRFDLGPYRVCRRNSLLSCRHGRLLVLDHMMNELVVCTPLTGEQRRVTIPPELLHGFLIGAVVCAASDQGHVHGGCHSSPFKLVLVSMLRKDNQLLTCVYSSETRVWGNTISIATTGHRFHAGPHATLVDNALYWLLTPRREGILEFNLEQQSLVVFKGPPVPDNFYHNQIIKAKDGVVGFAVLSYPHLQMWQRNVNRHGVATWEMWKTIELHNILQIPPRIEGQIKEKETILGYSEDIDVIFISVGGSVYMVEFNQMEYKRLHESPRHILDYHPFASFYTPGTTVAGGCTGADMLHNT